MECSTLILIRVLIKTQTVTRFGKQEDQEQDAMETGKNVIFFGQSVQNIKNKMKANSKPCSINVGG